MENATQITDVELLEKLKNSPLEDGQKTELEALMPQMTDTEKTEINALIDQANDEMAKADATYQENLKNLNQNYTEKLKKAEHEQSEKAAHEFEKLDKQETAEELKEFEGEIEAMPTNAKKEKMAQKTKKPTTKNHAIRNIILIFITLILIATGVLYALTTL